MKLIAALAAATLALAGVAHAQSFPGLAAPNSVVAGPSSGGTSAPPTPRALVPADLPLFGTSQAGAVPQSGGGTANFLRADGTWQPMLGAVNSQSGNYTIAATDCNGMVVETGAFQTITLPASLTGFPSFCPIRILNGNSTRAAALAGFPAGAHIFSGCGSYCLFPQQSVDVHIVGGSWVVSRPPIRWRVVAAPTIYVNASAGQIIHGGVTYGGGSDNNDGLSASAPLQHIQTAVGVVQGAIDFGGGLTRLATIQLACNTDASPVAYAEAVSVFGPLVGAEDFTILGDAADPNSCNLQPPNGQYGINAADQGIVTINGFKIIATSAGCVYSRQTGDVDLNNINCNADSASNDVIADYGGAVNINSPFTSSGGTTASIFVARATGGFINIAANVTLGTVTVGDAVVQAKAGGLIQVLNSATITGTVTGNACDITYGGIVMRSGTTIPGTACTAGTGGILQ